MTDEETNGETERRVYLETDVGCATVRDDEGELESMVETAKDLMDEAEQIHNRVSDETDERGVE